MMTDPSHPAPPSRPSLCQRLLLHLFPKEFREEHGKEWVEAANATAEDFRSRGYRIPGAWAALHLFVDTCRAIPLVWGSQLPGSRNPEKGQLAMLDALGTDLRFAFRTLRKNPGFSLAALLTLAMGIGATTTVFSIVNGVLLDPLPYPEPQRLATVWMTDASDGSRDMPWSVPRLKETVQASRSFSEISGYSWEDLTLTEVGEPELVYAVAATNGLLTTLGVQPELGRDLREEESNPGQPLVAVISHSFWAQRLGSDPEVLGRTLELSQRSYEIVGVAPPGFSYPNGANLWIPGQWPEEVFSRDRHFLRAVGRLAPGFEMNTAQAEMDGVILGLQDEDPGWNPDMGVYLQSLTQTTVGDVRLGLLVLLGAVGMVLLIACANVANLLLARGATRAGEMAVRSTLGAGRSTLIRQLMTESLVLSAAGGGIGLLLSFSGVHGLRTLAPRGIPRLDNISVDARVVGFALITSLLVALVFGLAPALRLTRTSIASVIRSGRESLVSGRGREFARSGLLVGEVALSLSLLLGAGLLLKSFARIHAVELGFEPRMVQQFTLSLPEATYDEGETISFFQSLESKITSLPGVEGAGMGSGSPLGRSHTSISFTIQGKPEPLRGEEPVAYVRIATPGYLPALGVPLLQGRGIESTDLPETPRVAVISARAAAEFWPEEDPIGQRFFFAPDEPAWTVVGVVGDVRSLDVTMESSPEIYFPHTQWPRRTMTVEVLHGGRIAGLERSLRTTVSELDPNLAVYWMEALQDRVDLSTSSQRFYLLMVGLAASLAMVLAAVGLFGVVAFLVSRRTREIGIRIALGARQRSVVGMVLKESMPPVLMGLLLGVTISLAGGRVLSSLLFQVEPWDPATFATGSILFLLVATGATLAPARRAAGIAPTEAIREE